MMVRAPSRCRREKMPCRAPRKAEIPRSQQEAEGARDDAADVHSAGLVLAADEDVEDVVYASYAMRRSHGLDWKCLDYLDWLRWPDGFVCPWCGSQDGWRAPDRRWRCAGCDRRVSATAGTIFHGTRTPLTVWFSAAWHLTGGKGGISATELRREMQLGSYQTAWAMLHRYRSVMVRPGRNRLTGDVEVDESFLGGPEAGIPGRGALGKVLFAAAVEVNSPSDFGRARLDGIKDASADSLQQFLLANVEPGSRIVTDGWAAYPKAIRGHYTLKATSVSASGRPAHEALPGVHLVFSLVKRWVMGTLHGSISPEHLPAYFDEWVFRFNRRNSRSRGLLFQRLLQQAVEGDALTYNELRKAGRTRPPPPPPDRERMRPPSLEREDSGLPWRDLKT